MHGMEYYVNDSSTTGDVYTTAAGLDSAGRGTNSATPLLSLTNLLATYVINPGDKVFIDTGVYSNYSVGIGVNDDGNSSSNVFFIGSTNIAAGGSVLARNNSVADGIVLSGHYIQIENLTIKGARDGVRIFGGQHARLSKVRLR